MLARARSRELDPRINACRVIGSVQTSNVEGGQTFKVSKLEGCSKLSKLEIGSKTSLNLVSNFESLNVCTV